ncbi:MAG: UDP-N-acetylglucosamine 2-epimerase (non-hydrolyzing) [Syntrophomonadaceae bacterium]|jgi:UDP-N-acetylglucosamine 2-epimerase (non-hydrolysing)|nr:UDP-N-acetylglucosamine 2-epimerase (non-hydrolyzing) [Syntrophomonadaceae bacterium]
MVVRSGKVMTVFGTRPEAIKMAPVIRALKEREDIETLVAVTAQHREMLDQVLNLFNIKPDYDLNLMRTGQDLFSITCGVLNGLKEILEKEEPGLLLVHGDTTTTLAAALAAFYLHIPVGHVEAGLRTRNKYSPFPEEMNRTLTGSVTDLHFAPTDTARDNLIAEAAALYKIWVTGNTVIDALLHTVKDDYVFGPEFGKVDFNKRLLLVTTHRRENWGEKMRGIYRALIDLTEEFPGIEVVFPVHKNPVVRDVAYEMLGKRSAFHLMEPLDYEPFANLIKASYLILTDSGGLQEEAPSLGKPVLVLRDTTERPEAVAAGTVKLVGTAYDRIYEEAKLLLSDESEYNKMARAVNPYGDGKAAERIVNIVADFLYARRGAQL